MTGIREIWGPDNRLYGFIIHSENSSDSVTEPAQVKSHFDKSIAMFTETKMKNELALAYTGYGHYHKKTGKVAKTREYFIKNK
jgi:hypothetical protein